MKFSDDYRPRGHAARAASPPADLDWSDVWADAARMEEEHRNASLDRLALGSNCPRCGAGTDEPCRTARRGAPTEPHAARIDRAVRQYPTAGETR